MSETNMKKVSEYQQKIAGLLEEGDNEEFSLALLNSVALLNSLSKSTAVEEEDDSKVVQSYTVGWDGNKHVMIVITDDAPVIPLAFAPSGVPVENPAT